MKRRRLRPVSKRTRTERWPVLKSLREHVLTRAKGRCEAWKLGNVHAGPIDIHHVMKRAQGGKDHPDNVIALCRACHVLTDFPYILGRLVVTPRGHGRFSLSIVFARDKFGARALEYD